jgi:glutathione peroxidase
MSIFDAPIATLTGEASSLAPYEGKALLLVNVASKCGLTPQYTGLEKLQETYAEEILEFCSTTYGVSFPLFEKIDVNGDAKHPIYAELEEVADADGEAGDVKWNFEKFLVSPSGQIVGRFRPQVEPEDPELVAAIEANLPV